MSDFSDNVRRTVADLEHKRNLQGKTTRLCEKCNGCGNMRNGRDDYDGYGRIWREADPCSECRGAGRFDVPCTPEVQLAALEQEISKLKGQARELRRSIRERKKAA